MRKVMLLCVVLAAAMPAAAQEERSRPRQMSHEIAGDVISYKERLDMLAKAIKRDAYLVAQMVHATADLQDFQRNAAIEKAIDRVTSAKLRAAEQPPASPDTQTALNKIDDALHRARQQASSADLGELRETILKESYFIQRDLFRGVDIARREREMLIELQKRLADTNLQLEAAMIEALGSTMNFIRAGGK